jgi:hypothetical protein
VLDNSLAQQYFSYQIKKDIYFSYTSLEQKTIKESDCRRAAGINSHYYTRKLLSYEYVGLRRQCSSASNYTLNFFR